MELSKQVISLDLAKQLKKLGVKQDSLWWWVNNELMFSDDYFDIDQQHTLTTYEAYSAYTTSELGEMLPFRLRLKDNDHWLRLSKAKNHWDSRYVYYHRYEGCHHFEQGETLANVMAKMLCWLVENKKIVL